MTTTVVSGIGRLYTNDGGHDRGATGMLTDAWLAYAEGTIVAVGTGPPPDADIAVDVDGRCIIPGFVDSHSHLVFAGDRSDEFAARMAGEAYAAGGINVTVTATRDAGPTALGALATHRRHDALRLGTTTLEAKSGYGLTVDSEARLLDVAATVADECTFLGAHVVPPEYAGRADDYVALVCGEMLARCAPRASWIDAFCETGAFDADQCRAVLRAGREAGLGLRLHANQLGFGPGAQVAAELGCASADHCTYLTDEDREALAASGTVATFLPATDFSTRQPYPDARRAIDAGVTVALACNCNPGTSYTSSMPFVIALAVRDLDMTIDEALWSATAGGAAALRRHDVGVLTTGRRADFVVLDAPSPIHLVYRPGMPLIHQVCRAGIVVGGL